jgi:hypothetical protein
MTREFDDWLQALEDRHLVDLTFSEVARALRALSSAYVERRGRLREGAALSGAGKRAAFALFYAPLHFLLVRQIVTRLESAGALPPTLVDLGCGTGAAGAAWGSAVSRKPASVLGIDRHGWPLAEAADTYRRFALAGRTKRADIARAEWPRTDAGFVASFALNELDAAAREAVVERLLERGRRGAPVLVVEPLAGSVAPWWTNYADRFARAGGRSDEWRFSVELPHIVAKLDRAAGLNHRELTGRSLWLRNSRSIEPQ